MNLDKKLPLNAAALDRWSALLARIIDHSDGTRPFSEVYDDELEMFIAQARAALSLAARVSELEAANKALREALQDCFEWFDARADVDHVGDPMRPFPNAEAIQREHVLATIAAHPATSTPESV